MRVLVVPVDDAGVGNYRLRLPARVLADAGHDVVVDPSGPVVLWDRNWEGRPAPPPGSRVLGISDAKGADVVVTQRPTNIATLDTIRLLRDQGVAVVVDVDDRLDRVHRRHAGRWSGSDRQLVDNHRILDYCCAEADLVTTSTPALLDRYGHGHGVVLPNLIPRRYLDLWAMHRPCTVGWSGFVATHPGDLEVTGGAVQAAIDRNRPVSPLAGVPWSVHVVGTGDQVRTALRLRDEPTASGVVSFDMYMQAMAEIEVGIVPLAMSEFNTAKSCLKALEFASVETPMVMSPTPDNLRLHRLGVGLVAESRGQWVRHLSRLMGSPGLRADLAGRGREAVTGLTYEEHADRWLEAWLSPVDAKVAA